MGMTVYFDTCALIRLTDDFTQPRSGASAHPLIGREAEAVAGIPELIAAAQLRWIASTVLEQKLRRSSDVIRRLDNLRLLTSASLIITPSVARRRTAPKANP